MFQGRNPHLTKVQTRTGAGLPVLLSLVLLLLIVAMLPALTRAQTEPKLLDRIDGGIGVEM